MMTDYFGRRVCMFWFCLISLIGTLLQSAAQNIAMFVIGRIILGFGTGIR